MGKTRLLAEAARVARRLGFRVGAGAAEPGAEVIELAPLMTALFDGAQPLLERFGLRELHSLPEQRYWLLQDLQAMLERSALDGPLLISLDDLQWGDSGTAAALRALPVRLADLPVAWILAFRPEQGSAQLISAIEHLGQGGAERIILGPLDDAAVAQVAEDAIDAEPGAALLDVVKGANGSPFVLMELLSGLLDEDLIRVVGGRAERGTCPRCPGALQPPAPPEARHADACRRTRGPRRRGPRNGAGRLSGRGAARARRGRAAPAPAHVG